MARREKFTYYLSVSSLANAGKSTPNAQVADAPFVIEETAAYFWQMSGTALAGTPLAEEAGYLSLPSSQHPSYALVLGKLFLDDKAAQNADAPINLIFGTTKSPRILTTPIEIQQKQVLRCDITNNTGITISGFVAFSGYKAFK